MWDRETEVRWQELADEVMCGMKEWRVQHPKASFQEIESALDERLAGMRARMLQDLALASAAARVGDQDQADRPRCPQCGGSMEARGDESRSLTTNYNKEVKLTRSYLHCPTCESGLFPPR